MTHNVWPFLGSLGRLVEVPFTATESVSGGPRYVERATVEGRRRVQALPSPPRSWSVDVSGAASSELSGVSGFLTGAWGAGPWHWVPVQAQRGNMLTPREAVLLDRIERTEWSQGGPVQVSDGSWVPSSMVNALGTGAGTVVSSIPVLPGVPVTYSVDALGAGSTAPQTALRFYAADGSALGGSNGAGVNAAGWQRVSVSQVAPEGAASAAVGVYPTATRIARPQVTWTDAPVPWSAGHGCRAAVVDGWSEDLIVANSYGTYSNAGFTVMEVS